MRHAQRPARRHAAGFSLLEMLMVMVLVAAATALAAITMTGGLDALRLRSAAKEVGDNLRFARVQAISMGAPQRFSIDPRARTWQGAKGRHGELPRQVDIVFTGARQAQPRDGIGAIVFFPDGASTGGRIQVNNGKGAFNVDVAWLTGEVSLHRAAVDGR